MQLLLCLRLQLRVQVVGAELAGTAALKKVDLAVRLREAFPEAGVMHLRASCHQAEGALQRLPEGGSLGALNQSQNVRQGPSEWHAAAIQLPAAALCHTVAELLAWALTDRGVERWQRASPELLLGQE